MCFLTSLLKVQTQKGKVKQKQEIFVFLHWSRHLTHIHRHVLLPWLLLWALGAGMGTFLSFWWGTEGVLYSRLLCLMSLSKSAQFRMKLGSFRCCETSPCKWHKLHHFLSHLVAFTIMYLTLELSHCESRYSEFCKLGYNHSDRLLKMVREMPV